METIGGRESPPGDGLDRILRRFEERRRRRRIGGLVVGLATAVAVVAGSILWLSGESSPTPGSTSSPGGSGERVYRDPAGWSLTVPRGWVVEPFSSSDGGVVAAGAQVSNVTLPAPTVVDWAPIQADGRSFPKTGISIVVGTQQGGRVPRSPVSDLPLTYPTGWGEGSALAGEPTLSEIWFRGGGHLFIATVKTGADAVPADRKALERIVWSIRFESRPVPASTETPATSRGSQAPLWAEFVLPTTMITAGSSISGSVVLHNDTGRVIQASGCGSLFAVALGNDEIVPDVAWRLCLTRFTIPIGASSWPIKVSARYLECGAEKPLPPCTDGRPPPLPPGDYRAMFFQSSHLVPRPPSISVHVTP
ncbi:MAG: hypothetical protein ACJ77A_08305 [Actinomycetota bacterium]